MRSSTLLSVAIAAAIFEGVDTPWLTPAVLGEMGYAHVSFPASLVFRIVGTMQRRSGST